jgi:hypothetical protein
MPQQTLLKCSNKLTPAFSEWMSVSTTWTSGSMSWTGGSMRWTSGSMRSPQSHETTKSFRSMHEMISRFYLYKRRYVLVPPISTDLPPLSHSQRFGHGLELARAVNPNRQQLFAPAQLPAVGTTPPNFDEDLPNYRHMHILNLIIFYNDDFGIQHADTIGTRIDKFRRFLTRF